MKGYIQNGKKWPIKGKVSYHLLVSVAVHQRWRITKFLANSLFVIQSNWGLVSFLFVIEGCAQYVILQIFQTKIIGVINIYIAWTSLEKAQMWKHLEQMDMVANNWIFVWDFNMVEQISNSQSKGHNITSIHLL